MLIFPNRTAQEGIGWMLWRWQQIGPDWLRLYVFNTPLFGVKIHWFKGPDPDRDCHDHPWWFFSFMLKGAYEELIQHVYEGRYMGSTTKTRFPGSIQFRKASTIHRITKCPDKCVTLILNGPVVQDWGFWIKDGRNMEYSYWKDYQDG